MRRAKGKMFMFLATPADLMIFLLYPWLMTRLVCRIVDTEKVRSEISLYLKYLKNNSNKKCGKHLILE